MAFTAHQIKEAAGNALQGHRGSLDLKVSQVSTPESIAERSLVFVSDLESAKAALDSKASLILAPLKLSEDLQPTDDKCLFFFKDRSFAMAQILKLFDPAPKFWNEGIHPTAQVAATAELGEGVQVGAYAVIGESVVIGPNTQIAPHVVIEAKTHIGRDSVIGAHSFVGHSSLIGDRCRLKAHCSIGTDGYGFAPTAQGNIRIPQIGIVVLEDDVEIGSFTAIDRATLTETKIGRGTKIDNQVHIAHNCSFGEHCLVTAGFQTAGSSHFGNRFVCGGSVKSSDHIRVADNVILAGGSVIRQSIDKAGAYGGDPLQPMTSFTRTLLAIKELPDLRKLVRKLTK